MVKEMEKNIYSKHFKFYSKNIYECRNFPLREKNKISTNHHFDM